MLRRYKKQVLVIASVLLGLTAHKVDAMNENKREKRNRLLKKLDLLTQNLPDDLFSDDGMPDEKWQPPAPQKIESYASILTVQNKQEIEIENPTDGVDELIISIITRNVQKLKSINSEMAFDLYQVKNKEISFDDFAKHYLDVVDLSAAKTHWKDATYLAQKLADDTILHLLYDWGIKKYRILQKERSEKTPQSSTEPLDALCTTIVATLPTYARFCILIPFRKIRAQNITCMELE